MGVLEDSHVLGLVSGGVVMAPEEPEDHHCPSCDCIEIPSCGCSGAGAAEYDALNFGANVGPRIFSI